MNAFAQASMVEARSLAILLPFLEERADGGNLVITSKGRLAPFLQEVIGDILMQKGGNALSIEIKAEEKHTGNLFLETWSNRNLDDNRNHIQLGSNPGWLWKTRADLIFYHFLDADAVYVIDTFILQRWAFGFGRPTDSYSAKGQIYDFDEVPQGKYVQRNDTWGRLVPIEVLTKALNKNGSTAIKRLSIKQLSLDFPEAAE